MGICVEKFALPLPLLLNRKTKCKTSVRINSVDIIASSQRDAVAGLPVLRLHRFWSHRRRRIASDKVHVLYRSSTERSHGSGNTFCCNCRKYQHGNLVGNTESVETDRHLWVVRGNNGRSVGRF